MKITHNKEHCFLAVWVLQQYGNHPRIADADDENDDARDSSRTGHLPKELVRKIVEYLMCPQTLEIEFDLAAEGDVEALRGTVDFLCKAFLRQPDLRGASSSYVRKCLTVRRACKRPRLKGTSTAGAFSASTPSSRPP